MTSIGTTAEKKISAVASAQISRLRMTLSRM
jgi:hypothetical protein